MGLSFRIRGFDSSTLELLELGPVQRGAHLAVVPLLSGVDSGPEYITLSAAMAAGVLTVADTSASGWALELMVVNTGTVSVVLIDGEELIGGKKNRSVNASMLLSPHTETKIPVSSTEHGRRAQEEDGLLFSRSENDLAFRIRQEEVSNVSDSLRTVGDYASSATQAGVWDGIEQLSDAQGTSSPTSTMKDLFEASKDRLDQTLSELNCLPNQCGSIFLIGGQVAGCELVSRRNAYEGLHEKLVRSYDIETDDATSDGASLDLAAAFLKATANAAATEYNPSD